VPEQVIDGFGTACATRGFAPAIAGETMVEAPLSAAIICPGSMSEGEQRWRVTWAPELAPAGWPAEPPCRGHGGGDARLDLLAAFLTAALVLLLIDLAALWLPGGSAGPCRGGARRWPFWSRQVLFRRAGDRHAGARR
jgi:hypothetical protein